MKITIVCEKNVATESEEGRRAYPQGMDGCLSAFLTAAGHGVACIPAGEDGVPGLTEEILEGTDVLFWWGHAYHGAVCDGLAEKVAQRVLRGMGLIVLHSGHDSKIIKKLLGTSCSLV